MCLKSNSTQSVNTCKSSRSHHLGDFHTVKTQPPLPAQLIHSVSARALLLQGNSGSNVFWQLLQKTLFLLDVFGQDLLLNPTSNPSIEAIWRLKKIALFLYVSNLRKQKENAVNYTIYHFCRFLHHYLLADNHFPHFDWMEQMFRCHFLRKPNNKHTF